MATFFKKLIRNVRKSYQEDSGCPSNPEGRDCVSEEGERGTGGQVLDADVTGPFPCPKYGIKSVIGLRPHMEDSYTVVPEVVSVPSAWVHHLSRDRVCGVPEAGKGDSSASEPRVSSTADITQNFLSKSLSSRELSASREDLNASTVAVPGSYIIHLLAVYDGHGGASVSDHCSKKLHEHLKRCIESRMGTQRSKSKMSTKEEHPIDTTSASDLRLSQSEDDHVSSALTETFLLVDKDLYKKGQAIDKGTTAVVVLAGQSHIWVSNCGDSRAVLAREGDSISLSSDHKASRPDEVHRVEMAGGFVWWNRVMGELAISRAIGDHKLRPYVIAEPEVTRYVRKGTDQLLIIASDGLWDVLSSVEACNLALCHFHRELTASGNVSKALKGASDLLTKSALERGSRDNITVLVADVRLMSS
ncbi:hypothetical protein CEUSTIGMA_g5518.t1 [Chlamydomonas eustigma]|uniref:protein-serine/threonine phosphatase n=1 Tax=Chlamydomonas eustigma TaxID=1157962 RepID=A0A250X4V3_9CHLO|nr:hypothetical protein CEUSTIGMA_g5518.t1 [Chlamydomonas eustigma]|eukprot:GAX78076.1 hypothetical protein CEUSTIGMA_g5518.t1 [Chlamydomonas eustigma]